MPIKQNILTRYIPTLLITLAVIAVLAFVHYYYNLHTIKQLISGYGVWTPTAFVVLFVVANLLMIPSTLLTIAGGLIFGVLYGFLYNMIGASIGALLAFLVARYSGQGWVERRMGVRMKLLVRGVEREGWRFIMFTRLMPFTPYNILNFALGLTRISFMHYAIPSVIFMIPSTIAFTYIGSLGEVVLNARGQELAWKVSLALVLLTLLAYAPRFIAHWRKARNASLTKR